MARRAMVVSREANATDAGVAILRQGGNAVDAAVAVGFALAVTHPSAGNLGGGGFMLIRFADGRSTFIDFRERAPRSASADMYLDASGKPTRDSVHGWRASGVPGTVRGLEYAARRYGRLHWRDQVAPAAQLAAQGFQVSYGLARSLKAARNRLEDFPESRRIFLKAGAFFEPGDTLVQPELAATLERIAERGAVDFYEGETAGRLAAEMKAHGGTITLEDLKEYQVVERRPLEGSYRGYRILTAPPPSSGGVGILQMLGMLEESGYEKHGLGSAATIHYLTEVMRRYYADRAEHLGDPDFEKIPVEGLLSPRYIAELRRSIDPEKATPSGTIRPGRFTLAESEDTTHYSVMDADGNAAAVTYTINGSYGSGVTVPGLGFLLNNEMDDFTVKPGTPNMFGLIQGKVNGIRPGKRPLSSMTPTIVLRDDRPYLVLGSPGGSTIITTVLHVLINVLDFGLNLRDAVDQPRFHHQWQPDRIDMEPGFSPDTIGLLRGRGHTVERRAAIGEVAAILAGEGWLHGVADARSEGKAGGY